MLYVLFWNLAKVQKAKELAKIKAYKVKVLWIHIKPFPPNLSLLNSTITQYHLKLVLERNTQQIIANVPFCVLSGPVL